MPDASCQTECLLDRRLDDIRDEMGLDPFMVSCQLCFAQKLPDEFLLKFARLDFSALYEVVGTWLSKRQRSEGQGEYVPSPNFLSFLTAHQALAAAGVGAEALARGRGRGRCRVLQRFCQSKAVKGVRRMKTGKQGRGAGV